MRLTLILSAIICTTVCLAVVACNQSSGITPVAAAIPDSASMVRKGEYLVNAIGCDDCHSPKKMGAHGPEIIPELRFSGFPHDGKLPPIDSAAVAHGWALFAPDLTSATGAWGTSFAGNISGDATGIGNWKEENFIRAIREGKFKGLTNGRPLLPPMPWPTYRNLTDEDLKSIFAYLKTTRPVKNVVPAPLPPVAGR